MVALEVPSPDTSEQAKAALVSLRSLAKGRRTKTVTIRTDVGDDLVRVPREAF